MASLKLGTLSGCFLPHLISSSLNTILLLLIATADTKYLQKGNKLEKIAVAVLYNCIHMIGCYRMAGSADD